MSAPAVGQPRVTWDNLLWNIRAGRCTPFLGAGASSPNIPTAGEIAKDWCNQWGRYWPLQEADRRNLAKVAEHLCADRGGIGPRDLIGHICKAGEARGPLDIHRVLAKLPFPLYLTTNYDDLMCQALEQVNREPVREIGQTQPVHHPRKRSPERRPPWADPPPPKVHFLHGHHTQPASLVLTESDYLDFTSWMMRPKHGPPPDVRAALSNMILFVGYSLSDQDFLLLLRSIAAAADKRLAPINIAVQLPPEGVPAEEMHNFQVHAEHVTSGLTNFQVQFVWSTLDDFAKELSQRWEKFVKENPLPCLQQVSRQQDQVQ